MKPFSLAESGSEGSGNYLLLCYCGSSDTGYNKVNLGSFKKLMDLESSLDI